MNPAGLHFLLHCHFLPDPYPTLDSPTIQRCLRFFLAEGILEHVFGTHDAFQTTPRGRALVSSLCAVPLPTPAWLDAKSQVIR